MPGGSSQAADHPALGVCLDSFHILSRGTSLDAIADIPAGKLFFLQLADAPHLIMDVLQWSRHYRCFPGQGGFDLSALHLRAYSTPATPARSRWRSSTTSSARPTPSGWRSTRCARCCRSRSTVAPRTSTRRVPPPTALHGYAFVELAVEPAIGRTDASAAARPGLRAERAAPDQAGGAVANREASGSCSTLAPRRLAASPRSRSRATIPARSARSGRGAAGPDPSDAHAGRERQIFRRWPHLTEPRCSSAGAASRLTPAAGSETSSRSRRPGGRCRSGSSGSTTSRSPSRSITSTRPSCSTARCSGSNRTRASSWRRPHGLVRSRAVSSSRGSGVRLALNVPLAGAGKRTADRRPQHVAFACADVFAAARHLPYPGCRAAADPRQLLRRSGRAHRARPPPDRRDAGARGALRPPRRRLSFCTSTRR